MILGNPYVWLKEGRVMPRLSGRFLHPSIGTRMNPDPLVPTPIGQMACTSSLASLPGTTTERRAQSRQSPPCTRATCDAPEGCLRDQDRDRRPECVFSTWEVALRSFECCERATDFTFLDARTNPATGDRTRFSDGGTRWFVRMTSSWIAPQFTHRDP